jgi:hypothetical protein
MGALGRSALAGLLALMIGIGLFATLRASPASPPQGGAQYRDTALYRTIDHRVLGGESYYAVAVAEQRAHGFPLRPFITLRPPTLAWVIVAAGGFDHALLLLRLLMAAAIAAFALRLRAEGGRAWPIAALASAAGAAILVQPALVAWHEIWAALFLLLSLGLRTKRHWAAAVAAGLAAALIRELALPYLLAMAAVALLEHRRREAAGWIVALLIAVGALLLHAHALAAHITSADAASPGWLGGLGWGFAVHSVARTSLFSIGPEWLTAILLPLAIDVWISRASTPLGRRVAMVLLGYCAGLILFARADNLYWGALIAPIVAPGLAFAPGALARLAARQRRRSAP